MSTALLIETGETLLFITLLLLQYCSWFIKFKKAVYFWFPYTKICPNCKTYLILPFWRLSSSFYCIEILLHSFSVLLFHFKLQSKIIILISSLIRYITFIVFDFVKESSNLKMSVSFFDCIVQILSCSFDIEK